MYDPATTPATIRDELTAVIVDGFTSQGTPVIVDDVAGEREDHTLITVAGYAGSPIRINAGGEVEVPARFDTQVIQAIAEDVRQVIAAIQSQPPF